MTLATRAALKSANRWQESGFHRMPRAKGLGRRQREKALASKLDQLRVMTTVVADTGDLGAVACLKPVDCTTNPTIVLNAVDTPEYRDVVDEALA
jgi:Transaldolase/Fructose-6-phosphate aldolase